MEEGGQGAERPPPPQAVLYKLNQDWGLPSLSLACTQVEAYLRLARIPFAIQECSSASEAPGSQLPALDMGDDLVVAERAAPLLPPPLEELRAAGAVLAYLKKKQAGASLDRGLTASQRADAAAFGALVEARLLPALVYSTWCEPEAYSAHTRPAFGKQMPFPLSYLIPRGTRKAVAHHFAGSTATQLYQAAAEALDALASRMGANTSGGDYFFGSQASSLDALLYSVLSYIKAAPVMHPQLRRQLQGHRVLVAYVDRLSEQLFAAAVPSADEAGVQWSQWEARGGQADDRFSKQKSEQERTLQRKGRVWLLCAGAVIAAYVLLSGQYIEFQLFPDDFDEEADEEE